MWSEVFNSDMITIVMFFVSILAVLVTQRLYIKSQELRKENADLKAWNSVWIMENTKLMREQRAEGLDLDSLTMPDIEIRTDAILPDKKENDDE